MKITKCPLETWASFSAPLSCAPLCRGTYRWSRFWKPATRPFSWSSWSPAMTKSLVPRPEPAHPLHQPPRHLFQKHHTEHPAPYRRPLRTPEPRPEYVRARWRYAMRFLIPLTFPQTNISFILLNVSCVCFKLAVVMTMIKAHFRWTRSCALCCSCAAGVL